MTGQPDPVLERFNQLQDFLFSQLQKDNFYLQEISREDLRRREKARLSAYALKIWDSYQEFQK